MRGCGARPQRSVAGLAVVSVMVLIPVMSVVAIIAAVSVSVAFAVTAFFPFFARFFTGSVFAVVATGIEYGVEC